MKTTLLLLSFHVSNNGLPAVVHMHMFDADKLVPAMTQAPKNFHLHRIRFHQTSGGRPEQCNSPLRSKSTIQLGEDRHSGCGVQAIWTASAPSISSVGAAASIIARAALTCVSEIVPKGERPQQAATRGVHEVAGACAEPYSVVATSFWSRHQGGGFVQRRHRPPQLDANWRKAARLASRCSRHLVRLSRHSFPAIWQMIGLEIGAISAPRSPRWSSVSL